MRGAGHFDEGKVLFFMQTYFQKFNPRSLRNDDRWNCPLMLHSLRAAQKAVDHTARVVVLPRDLACRVNGSGDRIGCASYVERGESAVSLPQKAVVPLIKVNVTPLNCSHARSGNGVVCLTRRS